MTHTTYRYSSHCEPTVGLLSDLRIDVKTVGMIAVGTVGIGVHLLAITGEQTAVYQHNSAYENLSGVVCIDSNRNTAVELAKSTHIFHRLNRETL